MTALAFPTTLNLDQGISGYFSEISKFPFLEKEEEFMLAERWQRHDDTDAAGKLVTSHLRLVAKIAMGYRGYGLPLGEVISEGNVGLMRAVRKFDPDKGFRLATYAMWWIKAAIQEYVLRSWSLVKLGTTAAQKRLFFNLRKLKGDLQAFEEGHLSPENVAEIARRLDVSESEVHQMNNRLTVSDTSLNSPLSGVDGGTEWQDILADENAVGQEDEYAGRDQFNARMGLLESAMESLNEREKCIFTERRLKEEPATLEELSQIYNVSRERIRQIEVRAFEKLQKIMQSMADEQHII